LERWPHYREGERRGRLGGWERGWGGEADRAASTPGLNVDLANFVLHQQTSFDICNIQMAAGAILNKNVYSSYILLK
jgi:hypothetical protein